MKQTKQVAQQEEENVPVEFQCPISMELMKDPVLCEDGHTYERSAIEKWFEVSGKSPLTGMPLESKKLVSNVALRSLIEARSQKNHKNNLQKQMQFMDQFRAFHRRQLQIKDDQIARLQAQVRVLNHDLNLLSKHFQLAKTFQPQREQEAICSKNLLEFSKTAQVVLAPPASKPLVQAQIVDYSFGRFVGFLVNGLKEGLGELTYRNGNSYRGTFRDDKFNGSGVFLFANGDVFDGTFANGVRLGPGKLTKASGEVLEGFWEGGVLCK